MGFLLFFFGLSSWYGEGLSAVSGSCEGDLDSEGEDDCKGSFLLSMCSGDLSLFFYGNGI